MLALFALTLGLGAFLLFLVQPMVAKMLLPLLGGSPAVWNTCMAFFQAVLLGGYAYAHFVPSRVGVRRHAPFHVALIALPLLLLPLRLGSYPPPATERPVPWLLGVLLMAVGAPAFALATSAPLLQRWFAATLHRQGRDPYFLYVASNAGSMAALLGYPLLIEPRLPLAGQNVLWTAGYALLVGLTLGCAVLLIRRAPPGTIEVERAVPEGAPLERAVVTRWILLALAPSSLMLGVTTFITTDIAPIPLFWVLPLAFYLLTFIVAFARPGDRVRQFVLALLPVAILALVFAGMAGNSLSIGVRVAIHLTAFFVAALVCHGELAASRPARFHLTAFYLAIATGGVLGGILNALIAPVLFPRVIEYPLMIALVALLRPRLFSPAAGAKPRFGAAWTTLGTISGLIFLLQAFGGPVGQTLLLHRDFFGVIRVRTDAAHQLVGLQHGTTVHGIQSRAPRMREEPLGYYSRPGPIGQLFAVWDSSHAGEPVGVVGLGAGTLACYARRGQSITFYEIDPAIDRAARDTTLFTYLADADRRGARTRIVIGDGRLRLAASSERYGMLVLDAFSSDAIPVHLLTREAMRVYLDHLAPGGWLAIHFSSRYVTLDPALASLARDRGLACRIENDPGAESDSLSLERSPSSWVVMARDEAALSSVARDPRWTEPAGALPRPWTDDHSSLLGLIRWSARPAP
ncbi:MAG TPA: fused MFS/spermidine synthase [Candidatus Udaeobacter sp.]|jgi:hypothetical protein|nr:fused MFS/spermidine synthase [Candidatus Udaeobacter sp.]